MKRIIIHDESPRHSGGARRFVSEHEACVDIVVAIFRHASDEGEHEWIAGDPVSRAYAEWIGTDIDTIMAVAARRGYAVGGREATPEQAPAPVGLKPLRNLARTRAEVLAFVAGHAGATTNDVAAGCGITASYARHLLRRLAHARQVRRDAAGGWECEEVTR